MQLDLPGGITAFHARPEDDNAYLLEDIEAGRLVQPFPLMATDDTGYWLVYPEERQNVAKIKAFRDWILAEVAADRAARERSRPRLAAM